MNTAHDCTVTILEEAENIQLLFYDRPGYGQWHIVFDKDLCGVKKETFRVTYKSAKKYFDKAVKEKKMSTCNCTLDSVDVSCERGKEIQWRLLHTKDLLVEKKYISHGRTKKDIMYEIKTYEKAWSNHVNGK